MGAAHDQPESENRGQGGLLTEPVYFKADLAIIKRVLTEQWDIPKDCFAKLPTRLAKILAENPKLDNRDTVRIAQTLDRMVRTNQRAAALATSQGDNEGGYQPSELHKHEHIHVESPAEAPAPAQIEVILVNDWYGSPDVLPAKKNGKAAKKNGRAKKKGK